MKILFVLWTLAAFAGESEFDRRFRLGRELERTGDVAAAAREFEALLPDAEARGGNELGLTLNNLGAVYRQMGRYAEAERSYLRAAAMFRQPAAVAVTLNNLGALDLVRGLPKRAQWYYGRARKLDPGNAQSVHGLAHAAHLLGRFGAAEKLYLEALRLEKNPLTQADISYNLAMLYNDRRSIPLLERAAATYEKLAPNHPKLAAIRQRDASTQVASSKSRSAISTPGLP